MEIVAHRREGYQLLHDGLIELSSVEANGIRIDMGRLRDTKEDLQEQIRKIRQQLEDTDVWDKWRRRYGPKAKITSRDQLGEIFYNQLGFKAKKTTESGADAADAESLSHIKHPFIEPYQRLVKLDKALGTFLKGIEFEVVNGRLHPVFNLHTVRTYRSSSDSPNFQNFPVRDKEIAKIIRSLFIATDLDSCLVENDFKGIEVGVSACYHLDRNFIRYIEDTKNSDMHRDMAQQIFCLTPDQWKKLDKAVAKDARQGAKNKFVFPQFYGDYYVACAKALWEWIDTFKLVGPNGEPLKQWLDEKHGIEKLGECDPELKAEEGTFEKHIQEIENDFWNNRFREYGQWRRDFYKSYLDKGYFDTHTGFRVFGSFSRNQVTNFPVQGSAFHCLLWTLIQVNRKLRKYKMQSKVVGQIHDSLIGDVKIRELRDYLEIVEETATVELREYYKWLIVPLEIEYEIAPSTGSWHDKKPVLFKQGVFTHPFDKENPRTTTDPFKFMHALNNPPKESK